MRTWRACIAVMKLEVGRSARLNTFGAENLAIGTAKSFRRMATARLASALLETASTNNASETPGIEALCSMATGRPAQLDATQLDALRAALLQGAIAHGFGTELWTLKRVRALIERLYGVRFRDAPAALPSTRKPH